MDFFKDMSNSDGIKSKCLTVFSAALLVIALVPFFILATFNHPVCWDDFNAFASLLKSPVTISFGQRFSSQFNNVLFYPPMENFGLGTMLIILANHRIFSFIYITLFTLSFFFMMRELNRNILKAGKKLFFWIFSASFFLLMNFINLSSTLFYCHPATSGYTGGLIFMFLFLALVIRVHFFGGKESKKEKILTLSLLFLVTFILSGFIEIFVIFAAFVSLYVFLFAKNAYTKRRNPVFLSVFVFSLMVLASFFVANKGMIAAKYVQKTAFLEKQGGGIVAKNVSARAVTGASFAPPVRTVANEATPKKSRVSLTMGNSFFSRILPWTGYNIKFLKQEIKKIISPHNFPVLLFLFWLLSKTEISKSSYTTKKLLFCFFLSPVILFMSLSGCYSGLVWFTLYATVRNVFDVIFLLITVAFLYSLLRFAGRFVRATLRLEFVRSGFDFTKAAAFLVVASSVFFTAFLSEKYLVGNAWHDVLSGSAKRYDRIQLENYKKIFDSDDDTVVVEYPGFPKSLVNFQGNYIKFDPDDDVLFASKEVVRFLNKREIIYSYDRLPSETDLYTRERRQK